LVNRSWAIILAAHRAAPQFMELSVWQYAAVSLILFAGSIVQGAVGFAAGLFGIPLLVLTGIPFPDAVAISLAASAPQNIIPAWLLRREIDFSRALRPVLIRIALLPLGVFALDLVSRQSETLASQVVGAVVLAIVAVQRGFSAKPCEHLHPAWEWTAFSLSGFLLGFCGMGGPPMVLWVLAHDWPMNRARAFLFFLAATSVVPQAVFLWLRFGTTASQAMLLGAAATPAVLAGLWCGLYLGRLAPDRALRRISIGLLILVALSAMVKPYL
jgi:uncharacterized protein